MKAVLYSSLPDGHFRLIKVFCHNNRVSLYMKSFDLLSHPPYTAVSHAWDTSNQIVRVKCNKSEVPISRELLAAFRAFRACPELHSPAWLWVDSICINQTDSAEKDVQITIMDRIYQNANIVTIWIGTATESAQQCLRELDPFQSLIARCPPQASMDFVISRSFPTVWKELPDIFRRRWFSRSWVLQETILARESRLVCGTTVIDWLKTTRNHVLTLEESQSDTGMRRQDALGYSILKPFYHLQSPGSQPRREYDIHLLNLIRERECTQPADKVYSILGLISQEIRRLIVPDSSSDHWTVFVRLGKAFLQHHGPDLFILAPSVERPAELPSWMPNLSCPPSMAPLGYSGRAGKIDVVLGNVAERSIPEDSDITTIGVSGVRMTSIRERHQMPQLENGIQDRAAAEEVLHAIGRCTQLLKDAPHPFDNMAVIWTLIGGVQAKARELSHPLEDLFKLMMENIRTYRNYRDEQETPSSFMASWLLEAWKGACLFTTHDGNVGLGPSNMQEDDMVCVFFGASTPTVLRPTNEGTFQVIGPAYVFAYQDGTAFKARGPIENYTMFSII
ncbi:uncharacterized protein DNG_03518 [Cephalotrichum gorgonifer]|uniref:Heterokaryon incompatibility domain-containing protein n=1 Tax=Cephalotrichum gorgonifer TaxID=2041049 RepID=A0AAE8MUY4_9PEZI|nr:uncharacterized protein DNG_03518 [Cephalotrichum gorgonifer]